jgi:RHS repeat-associated protein
MRTKLILITLILSLSLILFSQETQPNYVLENPLPGFKTFEFLARDSVSMIEGYSYSPNNNRYLQAKTDPFMVFPPEEGEVTGGAPNNDEGGVVGTIPGNLMVSASGAAIYSIPINVPPGVNGMTPQLSLVYNSQGGNSILGIGWSLSGLSAITRTGTTLYNNGYIDGIDFDDNDQFMLNGQRLIPINEEKTEFRTEIESFSKIVIKETDDFGPVWFEVYTKDGTIMEFGNTVDSKASSIGSSPQVLSWSLNRIKDHNGNYIDYTYINSFGFCRISKISYGANIETKQEHFYNIGFHYVTGRNDIDRFWIHGHEFEQRLILTDIEVNYAEDNVSHYELWYDFGDVFTRLDKVTLISPAQDKFNPTVFKYTTPLPFMEQATSFRGVRFALGDFNGDGLTDYVSIPSDEENFLEQSFDVYINIGNGKFPSTPTSSFMPFHYGYASNLNVHGHYLRNCYDFNGDGFDDIIINALIKTDDPIVNEFYPQLDIFLSNGTTIADHAFKSIDISEVADYSIGDFNGDGKTDVFILNDDQSWEMHLGTDNILYGSSNFTSDFDKINAADFNGDGKTDLMFIHENGSSIYEYSNNSLVDLTPTPYAPLDYPNTAQTIFNGDFNGDGNADILTWEEPNIWRLEYFDGIVFHSNTSSLPDLNALNNGFYNYDPEYFILVADVDGNGKSDIVEVGESEPVNYTPHFLNIHYSNGLDFVEESTKTYLNSISGYSGYADCDFFNRGDFNGDGQDDIAFYFSFYEDSKIVFGSPYEFGKLLREVTNGLGLKSNIEYNPLTYSGCYTKGEGADYPLVDIQPRLNAVTTIVTETGVVDENGTSVHKYVNWYSYEGALLHKQGKGFLGFQKTKILNGVDADMYAETVNTYNVNDDYYFLWLESNSSYVDTENTDKVLITESTNKEPLVSVLGSVSDKRIFFYTPQSLSNVHHTGDENSSYIKTVLSKQYYSEDDILWGNLTSSEVYTDPENFDKLVETDSYDFYSKASFTYITDISNWPVSLPDEIKTEKWSTNDADNIDKNYTHFTYYPNSQLIQTTTVLPNYNELFRTVSTFGYDQYGNISSHKTEAPNFTPSVLARTTWYIYDEAYQHRFLTQTKNTFEGTDYITSSTYYAKTGLSKSSTNINGLTTNYYYDSFGRIEKTIYFDGVQDLKKLYWSFKHENNPKNGLYYTWSQRSGEQAVVSFANKLGKELLTIVKDFHKNNVFSETVYNTFGQMESVSNSYYSDSDALWTHYLYNKIGTVKKIISPTETIEYKYNGRLTTSTVTAPNTTINQETSNEVNAIGNTIKVTDKAGDIDYTYFSSGQISTATSIGATTRMNYNDAGFQVSLVEPSAGTTTYNYNPFGELISQTNANGHTYNMDYDLLGRIKAKKLLGTSDIVNFTYFTEGTNGFGQLQSISATNGIETRYDYDIYSRLKSKTETIDFEEYTYEYDFNIFGKIHKITWPSGFEVNYRYKNGSFYAVEQTGTDKKLWELTDINAQGQIIQHKLGNGLLTTKGYDQYGYLTSIYTENQVQDLKYDFNINTGNLNWRSTHIFPPEGDYNIKEDFTYDDTKLNSRLETWKVAGSPTQYSINYANNGNIEYKSDIGAFYYGQNTRPHVLSYIENPSSSYLSLAQKKVQKITYTAFNKTETIRQINPSNPEQNNILEITYGPNQSRRKTELYLNDEKIKTKYFISGSYEIEVDSENNTRKLHYLSAGNGLFAIYVIENDGSSSIYYIHKDHLGSVETITNENAEVVERLSYDPWGRRRNATDLSFIDVPTTFLFDRGYTTHEHLDDFDLINMNGRTYDPMLGRFLSPDNLLQAPGYSQNYNRYSYAFNNPLVFTDPSGYAVAGCRKIDGKYYAPGKLTNQETYGAVISSFLSMGLSGFTTPLSTGLLENAAYKGLSGLTTSFIGTATSTWMTGGSFTAGLDAASQSGLNGFISSFASGVINEITNLSFHKNQFGKNAVGHLSEARGRYPITVGVTLPEIEVVAGRVKVPSWWGDHWTRHQDGAFSNWWNSHWTAKFIPDVIYVNGGTGYALGAGFSISHGWAFQIRGMKGEAFRLVPYNAGAGKVGLHGFYGINAGYSSYSGDSRNFSLDESFFGSGTTGFEIDYGLGYGSFRSPANYTGGVLRSYDIGAGDGIGVSYNSFMYSEPFTGF